MHILILPSWYPKFSGDVSGVFFRQQAMALHHFGHRVGVVYPELRSLKKLPYFWSLKKGLESSDDEGLKTVRAHGFLWTPRLDAASRWLWIRHGLNAFESYVKANGSPDVIHAHSILNGGVLAKEISARAGVPFVITEHFTGYARGVLTDAQLKVAAECAAKAAERFAVSQPFCELLSAIFGPDVGSWTEMPNLVEPRFLEATISSPHYPPQESFIFANVSRLESKKGIARLIEAFSLAFKDDQTTFLEIGGDGPERLRLEALARESGVASRVRFLGALSRHEVLETMKRMNALVLSSDHETFGVVVIESLALGKPVVATRCGGPESILGKEDGIVVSAKDVPSLAEAMITMRKNIDSYVADDIRYRCSSRYSAESIASRLTAIYERVCS